MGVSRLSTYFLYLKTRVTWTAVSESSSLYLQILCSHSLCSLHYVSRKLLLQSKTMCAEAHGARRKNYSLASMPHLTLLSLLSGTSGNYVGSLHGSVLTL